MAQPITLYQMVNGRIEATVTGMTTDNCREAIEARGFHYVRDNFNARNRQELQGAPVFQNLYGPMWDGKRGIRYEDGETYRAMSQ